MRSKIILSGELIVNKTNVYHYCQDRERNMADWYSRAIDNNLTKFICSRCKANYTNYIPVIIMLSKECS